ncbi:hypothetical protein A6R68_05020 [Neotoma lepida]|uniref:Uncharacterized protein n=1 Tax=Neotoma lepida TaxID=56216 RepID=A0A1A6GJQ2_NEOLE|nr:hypothetical protein A6R68_05020 [Neotoma lepida]
MKLVMQTRPASAKSLATSAIRRMFSSRSPAENPRRNGRRTAQIRCGENCSLWKPSPYLTYQTKPPPRPSVKRAKRERIMLEG